MRKAARAKAIIIILAEIITKNTNSNRSAET